VCDTARGTHRDQVGTEGRDSMMRPMRLGAKGHWKAHFTSQLVAPRTKQVLAKYLYPHIPLKTLVVDCRVGRWSVLKSNGGGCGAPGIKIASGRWHRCKARASTTEYEGFGGQGGMSSSRRDNIGQWRNADTLSAAAKVRGTHERGVPGGLPVASSLRGIWNQPLDPSQRV
jgi:hypothetical protein